VQDGPRHAVVSRFEGVPKPLRRVRRALRPRPRNERGRWGLVVPLVVFGAGLLFATSARTAEGTDLRPDRRTELVQLIAERNVAVRQTEIRAAALRADVDRMTRDQALSDGSVQSAQKAADTLAGPAGLTAVHGPALTVTLDDAPARGDGQLPAGATVNDVVVHQQDVQAVVNALWAGGAEAMTIMGQRVVSTGAVRCVGNTLLLYGRTYSPPFAISAIGPTDSLRGALASSEAVGLFRDAARAYGLGYGVRTSADLRLPAYNGQISTHSVSGGVR
jgi:uncharacterized protein YlxW (UPF0749 family)